MSDDKNLKMFVTYVAKLPLYHFRNLSIYFILRKYSFMYLSSPLLPAKDCCEKRNFFMSNHLLQIHCLNNYFTFYLCEYAVCLTRVANEHVPFYRNPIIELLQNKIL